MQKENRYYVLKRADLDVALDRGLINSNDVDTLRRIHKASAAGRDATGKKGQDYCVVESDWPMYELVWEYISCWAEGRPNPAERQSILARTIADILGMPQADLPLVGNDLITLLKEKLQLAAGATRDDRHNNLGRRLCAMLGTPSGQLYPLSDEDITQRLYRLLFPAKKADHGAVTQGTAEENTQTMLSLRSQELRLQEENLQKGLRAFDHDKAVARKEIQAAKAIVYLAALVIFDQEQRGYELMPEAKLNGVGYLA